MWTGAKEDDPEEAITKLRTLIDSQSSEPNEWYVISSTPLPSPSHHSPVPRDSRGPLDLGTIDVPLIRLPGIVGIMWLA